MLPPNDLEQNRNTQLVCVPGGVQGSGQDLLGHYTEPVMTPRPSPLRTKPQSHQTLVQTEMRLRNVHTARRTVNRNSERSVRTRKSGEPGVREAKRRTCLKSTETSTASKAGGQVRQRPRTCGRGNAGGGDGLGVILVPSQGGKRGASPLEKESRRRRAETTQRNVFCRKGTERNAATWKAKWAQGKRVWALFPKNGDGKAGAHADGCNPADGRTSLMWLEEAALRSWSHVPEETPADGPFPEGWFPRNGDVPRPGHRRGRGAVAVLVPWLHPSRDMGRSSAARWRSEKRAEGRTVSPGSRRAGAPGREPRGGR